MFIGALLSWLLVLVDRWIIVVIGGGLVYSVIAGGAQKTMDGSRVLLFIDTTRKQRRGEVESIYQG